MSSLRRFQADPKNLLNTALSMYRSKRIKTAVVEGVCDKRFLSQWLSTDAQLRFDGFDGKLLVEKAFKGSRAKPYSDHDFLYFIADVDFDAVCQTPLHDHSSFVYNVFCSDEKKTIYNDLECFLVNTSALEKVLANFDVAPSSASFMRERLERASREIGAYRAADLLVQRKFNLRSSVLNGLEVRGFFVPTELTVESSRLKKALPGWSNYKEYVDDLIDAAARLDRQSPPLWSLSRGHDVTEMIALHLEVIGNRGTTREKLEMMLRLACEFNEFSKSPMCKKINAAGGRWFPSTSAG